MKLLKFLPKPRKHNLIYIRRVFGDSMSPTLLSGQIVIAVGFVNLRVGDVVIADIEGREVIKRIDSIDDQGIRLIGDNRLASTDSRDYGPVDRTVICSRVIYAR